MQRKEILCDEDTETGKIEETQIDFDLLFFRFLFGDVVIETEILFLFYYCICCTVVVE